MLRMIRTLFLKIKADFPIFREVPAILQKKSQSKPKQLNPQARFFLNGKRYR